MNFGRGYRVRSRARRGPGGWDRHTISAAIRSVRAVFLLDVAQHAQGHGQPNSGRDQRTGAASHVTFRFPATIACFTPSCGCNELDAAEVTQDVHSGDGHHGEPISRAPSFWRRRVCSLVSPAVASAAIRGRSLWMSGGSNRAGR